MTKPASYLPPETPVLRWMANMLSLWGLCEKPACRHAKACKRDPRECLTRYVPLVPEEVRDGVKTLLDGQFSRLTYDQVHREAPDDVEAVEEWMGLVEASARPWRSPPEGC